MNKTSDKVLSGGVGIVGLGRMGRCLVNGLVETGTLDREQIRFTTKHPENARALEAELKLKHCKDNAALAESCQTLVLAVKPQNAFDALTSLKGKLGENHTLISIVASVSLAQIEEQLGGGVRVVRAMPNTPVFVREGITAACLNAVAGERDWERTHAIFGPLGKLVGTDERHMDAVTGLSGCGPAYIYVVLESLTEAGIKVGLPRELARELASQTVLGAARMLQETGRHPAALKDEVTTPAGCTIDGLMELEDGKLRVTLIKAVVQATRRAQSLSKLPE